MSDNKLNGSKMSGKRTKHPSSKQEAFTHCYFNIKQTVEQTLFVFVPGLSKRLQGDLVIFSIDHIFAGIAVYPGGAKFLACGHYYNNVVTSKGKVNS